jgi:hypothetical protein
MQRHPAVVRAQSGLGNAKVPNVQARRSKPTAMWARASSAGSGAPRSSWRVRADRTRGRGATSPQDRCVRFFTACSKAPEAADYLCGLALVEPATIAAWGAPHGTGNRNCKSRIGAHEPLYDIDPQTGARIFYADRVFAGSFGMREGLVLVVLPAWLPTGTACHVGPFATSYAALSQHRDAMGRWRFVGSRLGVRAELPPSASDMLPVLIGN